MNHGHFLGARLQVRYTLGRYVTHVSGPTEVQLLLDIRPVTQNPGAPPLDLRLVIDRSTSMQEESCPGSGKSKLDMVKDAVREIIDDLGPNDCLSIVSFDQALRVDLKRTHMDAKGSELAKTAITSLVAHGNTFISDALREALSPNVINGHATKVLLFTDGDCTSDPVRDHTALVNLADQARSTQLPLLIYGTGVDYNWSLLRQLSVRAGNGSCTKHIMDMSELREHLRGELAYLRGTAVEGLEVSGLSQIGVQVTGVTRFMPDMHELPSFDSEQAHPYDFFKPGFFKDQSGALDVSRGQQYLINLLVDGHFLSECGLIEIKLVGRTTGKLTPFKNFHEAFLVTGLFTQDASQASPVNADVLKIQLMIAAARLAREQNYEKAEDLYRKAGDYTTATTMGRLRELHRTGQRNAVDVARTSQTMTGKAVSMIFTRTSETKE